MIYKVIMCLALGLWPRTFTIPGMAEVGEKAQRGASYGMIQVPVVWDFYLGQYGETYHDRYDYMFAPIWDNHDYFSRYHIGKAIWLDFLQNDRRFLNAQLPVNFSDPLFSQCFVDECVFIADFFQPDYLAIGTEIDEYIRYQPLEEIQALQATLTIAINRIHGLHPRTCVFVYFQYENVVQRDLWMSVSPFIELSDVVGFSSYPALFGYTGESLPNNYYDSIIEHASNKQIIFAEFGHPARSSSEFPNGSEADQTEFIRRWFRICPQNTLLATWVAVFDPNYGGQFPLFETMGLLHSEELTTSWLEWLHHRCPDINTVEAVQ